MATYKPKKEYMYGTGRRKSSVARVHLFPNGTGAITINGRDIEEYFGLETLKLLVRQPLARPLHGGDALKQGLVETDIVVMLAYHRRKFLRHGLQRVTCGVVEHDAHHRQGLLEQSACVFQRQQRILESRLGRIGCNTGDFLILLTDAQGHCLPDVLFADAVKSHGSPR